MHMCLISLNYFALLLNLSLNYTIDTRKSLYFTLFTNPLRYFICNRNNKNKTLDNFLYCRDIKLYLIFYYEKCYENKEEINLLKKLDILL